MPDADVVVVGAGIAGLTAARDLANGGLSVVVVEAGSTAGGKVARHTVDSLSLDAGAESFATRGGTVETLVNDLGLADRLVHPNPAGAWLYSADGVPHPLPSTGILGIPGTPMSRDLITILGYAGAFRAQMDAVLPGFYGSRERFLGPVVRKRMGRKVLDRLVVPVVGGVHSSHPDELAIDAVAPGLLAGLRKQDSLATAVRMQRALAPAGAMIAGLRGGVHLVADELYRDLTGRGVEVRFGSEVIASDARGVTIVGGTRITARHAVLTSAPARVDAPRITLATLVVDSPELDTAPRGSGVLVAPGAAGVRAKALTHATAKWAWLAAAAGQHRHVLRLSYDGQALHSSTRHSSTLDNSTPNDRELVEQARTDAETVLGVRIPASTVQDFARRQWTGVTAAATLDRPIPGAATVIGETASGIGLAAVIAQAREAATQVLSTLSETSTRPGDDGEHDNQPHRH